MKTGFLNPASKVPGHTAATGSTPSGVTSTVPNSAGSEANPSDHATPRLHSLSVAQGGEKSGNWKASWQQCLQLLGSDQDEKRCGTLHWDRNGTLMKQ